MHDQQWDRRVRSGETDEERADRNLADLLQEMRVTLSGAQILFAFLLIVPFEPAFRRAGAFEHAVYLATMVAAALGAGLLVAPAVMHRVVFGRHVKPRLVRTAATVALAGQGLFGLALALGLLLVADAVYGLAAGVAVATVVGGWCLTWWVLVPLRLGGRP